MGTKAKYDVEYVYRPGVTLDVDAQAALVAELRGVAATCFDELPDYQVIRGDPEALDHAVLTLARRPDGRLAGFCSARLLPIPHVGDVFHLGLTCVRPQDRGTGLTHTLLSQVIAKYLITHSPLTGAWFSNVASVLSSLGNVALYFDDVHPSPFRTAPPSTDHLAIARAIAAEHRRRLHLDLGASFCEKRFVFEGGNAGNVFHKAADDDRYHHRNGDLTGWYAGLADLDEGDAVLQVGRISLSGFARYFLKQATGRLPGLRWVAEPPPMIPVFSGGPT